jgi:hypothetical protein
MTRRELDSDLVAISYRIQSTFYLMSARVLANDFEKAGTGGAGSLGAIPFYYLMSHAFELLLKCALLKRGFDSNKLKSMKLRHDLRLLMDELQGFGVNISAPGSRIISAIAPQHKNHYLRYDGVIEGSEILMPPIHDMFLLYDELLLAGPISQSP